MDATLLAALRELPCAALSDADKSIRVMAPELRPVNPGHKLVGVARTVCCHEDFLTVIKALDESQPGEVLIVDTQGSRRAVVGELFTLEAARRGLAGIVVDGLVRDIRTIATLSLPVYARGSCPVSGTTVRMMQTQIAVDCGGVRVVPGDIVVGDEDGIIVASAEAIARLVPVAQEIERLEARLAERMAAGRPLTSLTNFAAHAAAVERGESSRLAFKLDG